MRKFIISLVLVSSFANFANAQVAQDNALKTKKANKTETVDMVNEPYPVVFENMDNIPENIKGDVDDRDDGYLLEGWQLGVGIGVLGGANAQIGYRIPQRGYNFWKNRFGFRAEYNSWKPLKSRIESYLRDNPIEVDDNEFTGMIEGTNYGALIDFYPFGNTWLLGNIRISAGYYSGDFSISAGLTKNKSETFEMKNDAGVPLEYTVDGTATLTAKLESDVKGPYAGIGFDFALLFGLKMFFDAGVVFTDKPKLSTDIAGDAYITVKNPQTGVVSAPVPVSASNSKEIRQLLHDTQARYQEELDEITKEYFPMVRLGFLVRF